MKFLLFLYYLRMMSVQYFFKRTFTLFLFTLFSLGLRNWICRNQRKTATKCRRAVVLFWQNAKLLTINLTYLFLLWIFCTPQVAWCTECRTSYGSPWRLTEPQKQRHKSPIPIHLREWFWCWMQKRICFVLWIAVVGLSPRSLILENSWLNEKLRTNDRTSDGHLTSLAS